MLLNKTDDLYLYRITKKKKVKVVSKLDAFNYDGRTNSVDISMTDPNIKLKDDVVYYVGLVNHNGEIFVRAIIRYRYSVIIKQITMPSQRDFDIIMTYLGSKHLTVGLPVIKQVVYLEPYTTVIWTDGAKTKVKSSGNDQTDINAAIAKRYFKDQSSKRKTKPSKSPKKLVKELVEKEIRYTTYTSE